MALVIRDFVKIAVLTPRSMLKEEQISDYDEVIAQLKNKGYEISYTSAREPEKLSREKVYDVFMWK